MNARTIAASDLTAQAEHLAAAMTENQAHAAFAAVVAQVNDIHGPMWSMDEARSAAAEQLLERLESAWGEGALTAMEKGLAKCLAVYVHDTDHPDLPDEEWAAIEHLLAALDAYVNR